MLSFVPLFAPSLIEKFAKISWQRVENFFFSLTRFIWKLKRKTRRTEFYIFSTRVRIFFPSVSEEVGQKKPANNYWKKKLIVLFPWRRTSKHDFELGFSSVLTTSSQLDNAVEPRFLDISIMLISNVKIFILVVFGVHLQPVHKTFSFAQRTQTSFNSKKVNVCTFFYHFYLTFYTIKSQHFFMLEKMTSLYKKGTCRLQYSNLRENLQAW